VISSRRGFTLIEVVVSVAILAFISIFTVQAIQRALGTRGKIQHDVDKNSTLRDALRVMERDVNMAFNYTDVNTLLYNQAQDERLKAAQQKTQQPNTPQPGAPPLTPQQQFLQAQQQAAANDPNLAQKYKKKEVKIWTKFIGKKDEMDFTSLSNVRLTEDAKTSSQAEIGYYIKPCRRRSTQEQSSKCLWRRVSNYIHDDITKFGDSTVLLENVSDFKLRYLGPGKDLDWEDAWSSDAGMGADDTTKGKFPYAVEITIEQKDPDPKAKDKALRMTLVAAIRNPNNPVPANPNDPNNLNGGQGQGQGQNPATPSTGNPSNSGIGGSR
jgi:prepilin-type N-terminal cleavage/methylation domain-containing protein